MRGLGEVIIALGKNLAFMHSCVQIMIIYPLISRERSSGAKHDTQRVSLDSAAKQFDRSAQDRYGQIYSGYIRQPVLSYSCSDLAFPLARLQPGTTVSKPYAKIL